ncbi:MAG: sigma-70 family RNA polymerase sigma factor [Bacteroidota bacterium]
MDIKQETLKKIADRDEEAFTQLFDAIGPTIYGLALRITESREKADKVVEESFSRIWRTASSYDPSRINPFYWIINIAKSAALENEARSDQFDFFAYQESNSIGSNLRDMLNSIDTKHRKVLELAFFRQMEESQIEQEMNIPVGTVATRLRLAIKVMRRVQG